MHIAGTFLRKLGRCGDQSLNKGRTARNDDHHLGSDSIHRARWRRRLMMLLGAGDCCKGVFLSLEFIIRRNL